MDMIGAVHMAGNSITMNGRTIQRCMICGRKLCDSGRYGGAEVVFSTPYSTRPETRKFSTFEVGAFVEELGGPDVTRWSVVGQADDGEFKIPDGCCIDLVE